MLRIMDSTCFHLPEIMSGSFPGCDGDGSKAAKSIQFEYDLKNGQVLDLSIHPFNSQVIENAQLPVYNNCSNDIFIRDLGYVSIISLQQIEKNKNFYINHSQSGISVWYSRMGRKPVWIFPTYRQT